MYDPLMKILGIIGIILAAIVIAKTGVFIIRKIFAKRDVIKHHMGSKRLDTMSTLLASVFRYAVYIVAIVIILSDVLQMKSILAAAGIGGIALGFGAQSLIKDMISGFFIVMEDQFAVGDTITVDSMTGTVEGMELRVTRIRGANGDLYTVPNGEIKKVINHSRGVRTVIIDIPLSYRNDSAKAFEAADQVCKTVCGEFKNLVEPPAVIGLTDMGRDGMSLRITAKTLPAEEYVVERRIRRLVKDEFSGRNIEFSEIWRPGGSSHG